MIMYHGDDITIEFHLASQVDGCRIQQLRNHIAVDGHPMSKFLWG